jgi:hypothetical protein
LPAPGSDLRPAGPLRSFVPCVVSTRPRKWPLHSGH